MLLCSSLDLTTRNHRTTEPDSRPIACSSSSGIKTKLLHWPTAPADWHKSGALYRTTASSCKPGNLFLAQRLHTQAQTIPVNLGHLRHTGRAHPSHHLWGHLHRLQKLNFCSNTHSILTLLLALCLAAFLQDLQGSCSHGWHSQDFCGSKPQDTTCLYQVRVRHCPAPVFTDPGPGFTVCAVSFQLTYAPAQ